MRLRRLRLRKLLLKRLLSNRNPHTYLRGHILKYGLPSIIGGSLTI